MPSDSTVHSKVQLLQVLTPVPNVNVQFLRTPNMRKLIGGHSSKQWSTTASSELSTSMSSCNPTQNSVQSSGISNTLLCKYLLLSLKFPCEGLNSVRLPEPVKSMNIIETRTGKFTKPMIKYNKFRLLFDRLWFLQNDYTCIRISLVYNAL